MSAAAERAAFAAAGRDLTALRGSAGERRAAGLLARNSDAPPVRFAELLEVPDWLRWPREGQNRLAQAVALRSMAPTLAGSIDGAWLGALAEAAGEDVLDWAIAAGAEETRADGLTVAPEALAARGFAILRAELPPALRAYLAWTPQQGKPATAEPGSVAEALAFVSACEAA